MATFNVHGAYTTKYGESDVWHELHSKKPGYGGLTATGSITVDRNSKSDKNITISGGKVTCDFTDRGSPWYEFNVYITVIKGGTLKTVNNADDEDNKYVDGGSVILSNTSMGAPKCSYNFGEHHCTFECTSNNTNIYVCFYCGQGGGCSVGYKGSSSSPHSSPIVVCSFNTSQITHYDPYSPPSTYAVTPPAMMRIDQTYSPRVQITCGSGGKIHWVEYKTFPSNKTWTYGRWSSISDSVKNSCTGTKEIYRKDPPTATSLDTTYNYNPSSNGNCSDSTQYKLAIRFSDYNYEYLSGDDRTFKTYRKPTMSITVPTSRVSPQDNATWSWSTNQRKWTGNNEEDPFVTTGKYTCNSVDKTITNISQDTSGSYTLNASHLNTYFTPAQRSVARLTASVSLVRENTKAKVGNSAYTASDTKSFTIQYQPNKTPTGGTVTNSKGESKKGQLIYIQETPTINIDWAYGFGGADGGVANGYIVRVYKKRTWDNTNQKYVYSEKYGNDIVVNVNNPGSAGTATINTETQLKRGILNYATITPFYNKPDPNNPGKIEGTSPLGIELCKPVSKLNAPIIDYPINDTTWHNKNFRILLQTPIDADLEELENDGKVTASNPYKYKNVKVIITANGIANTYTKTNTTIYSRTLENVGYNEKIAICPGLLSSHPNASSYKIEIQFQSNYWELSDNDAWGYVATRIVKNTAINRQTFKAGETKILIGHYKYVRDGSVRLHSVYPIKALDSNNVSKDQYDEIEHINYQGISNTIRDIRTEVNKYCTYDNTSVQFTQTIDDIVSKQEYITAQDRPSDIAGRNYMNILVDDMNKLT